MATRVTAAPGKLPRMIHGRPSLSSLTRTLSDVCMGRLPADLLISGGRLVNVHTREVLDGVARHTKEGYAFQRRAAEAGFKPAVRERDEPFGEPSFE